MKINFGEGGNSGNGSGGPLPEGRYNFRVSNAELAESPNKGTPQVSVWTKVVSKDGNNDKTRIMNFYLTEKSLWKLQSLMQVVNPEMAKGEIEIEDLIEFLNDKKPLFSAYAKVNGEYNDFNGFTEVSTETVDLAPSPASASTGSGKYDDLPF